MPARAEHSLGRRLKIRLFREEDVGHESLRVAINYWKPCALRLRHDFVSLQEDMIIGGESDLVACYRIWSNRLGLLEAVAVAPAQYIACDHQLKAAHLRIGLILLRININELYDPIAVRGRSRGKESGDDLSSHDDMNFQRVAHPRQHVGPITLEPLVLDQPRWPCRTHRNRTRVIGHGVRGVGDVTIERRFGVCRWRIEGQLSIRLQ